MRALYKGPAGSYPIGRTHAWQSCRAISVEDLAAHVLVPWYMVRLCSGMACNAGFAHVAPTECPGVRSWPAMHGIPLDPSVARSMRPRTSAHIIIMGQPVRTTLVVAHNNGGLLVTICALQLAMMITPTSLDGHPVHASFMRCALLYAQLVPRVMQRALHLRYT